jgi:hypothetical protein
VSDAGIGCRASFVAGGTAGAPSRGGPGGEGTAAPGVDAVNSWTRGIGRSAAVSLPGRIPGSSGFADFSGAGGVGVAACFELTVALPGAALLAVRLAALTLGAAAFLATRFFVVVSAALLSLIAVFFFEIGFFAITDILERK